MHETSASSVRLRMTSPWPVARAALLPALALLVLLAGCMSMVGLGYRHADAIAEWKADQYFDLDADQENAFRARFEQLYAWHRRDELPEYVAFLRDGKARLARGVAAADIEWFIDGVKSRYRRLVRRAAPDAADLLATLTPAQIEHLRQRWEDDNAKFAAEHRLNESLNARRQARAKRLLKQVRDWTGALSGAQEERIRALADALPDTERLRDADRKRRQREFLTLLEARSGDRKAFADRLARWLADWESGRDPEYARVAEHAWHKRVDFYVAVAGLLTPEQRNNLLQRVQGHIDEFRRLAQSG